MAAGQLRSFTSTAELYNNNNVGPDRLSPVECVSVCVLLILLLAVVYVSLSRVHFAQIQDEQQDINSDYQVEFLLNWQVSMN